MPRYTLETGRCDILHLEEAKHKASSFTVCAFLADFLYFANWWWKHVKTRVRLCNLSSLCCSDMNNRSIAWWLRQIGLSQYTKTLESEYYGLEVSSNSYFFLILLFNFYALLNLSPSQGLLNVTDGELKDAGIDDAGHRETIIAQLSRQRQNLDPHASNTHMQAPRHSRTDT